MGIPPSRSAAVGLRELLMSTGPSEGTRPVAVVGTQGAPRLSGSPPPLADLLTLLQTDPTRGAPLFYDRFQGEVNRLVWRLLGADSDHDDLVQQVFLSALRRISQVRAPEALVAWVRTITINIVYDEIRRRRVRRLFLRDAPQQEVHPSLVHDVEVRDFLMHAKRLLAMMPAAERMVFLLHVLEGKPLLEISELCGHSLATAKRRLKRANRRFEKLVARDPELARLLDKASSRRAANSEDEGDGA
jgi:RNA polymerase sigma-70 factor (ECF subfamily)